MSRQLTLDHARPRCGRGGWRPGAGRPRGRTTQSHDTRPSFPARHPQHITLRLRPGLPAIDRDWLMEIIRRAIRDSQKPMFRINEFNILSNHLHIVGEAAGKQSLARGVAGLEVRLAKRLNRAWGRRGKVFTPRYHTRSLRTPTEVRHALRYVLCNRKHHAPDRHFPPWWVDPCSSGVWFTGWQAPVLHTSYTSDLIRMSPPTAPPETWLLQLGWRRLGLMSFDERPAG